MSSSPVPEDGDEASRRMHDYLLNQQRRKQDYWMRKYGKAPPAGGSNQPSDPGSAAGAGRLPPLSNPPTGQPPLFHAKEPIPSFPSKGALNPDRRHRGSIPYVPAVLPPLKHPSQPSGQGDGAQGQAPHPQGMEGRRTAPRQTARSAGSRRNGTHSHKARRQEQEQQQQQQAMMEETSQPTMPAHPSGLPAPVPRTQMEAAVLKAIKAREETLDRLRAAASKLDASFGGGAPLVLSQSDPMVRLFLRLVGTLRQRTLDVVEAIAAWHLKTGDRAAFVYYGSDYLASIGPDLRFLDRCAFLATRLTQRPAVDDPFLVELTPDGIPLEEPTTMDLRRIGTRFSSDALRIRMARRVLSSYSAALQATASAHALLHPEAHAQSAGPGGAATGAPAGPGVFLSTPVLGSGVPLGVGAGYAGGEADGSGAAFFERSSSLGHAPFGKPHDESIFEVLRGDSSPTKAPAQATGEGEGAEEEGAGVSVAEGGQEEQSAAAVAEQVTAGSEAQAQVEVGAEGAEGAEGTEGAEEAAEQSPSKPVGYQGGFRPAQPLARNSSSTHTNKVFMKVELSWSQKRRQQGMTALAEDEEEGEGEEGEEEAEEGEEEEGQAEEEGAAAGAEGVEGAEGETSASGTGHGTGTSASDYARQQSSIFKPTASAAGSAAQASADYARQQSSIFKPTATATVGASADYARQQSSIFKPTAGAAGAGAAAEYARQQSSIFKPASPVLASAGAADSDASSSKGPSAPGSPSAPGAAGRAYSHQKSSPYLFAPTADVAEQTMSSTDPNYARQQSAVFKPSQGVASAAAYVRQPSAPYLFPPSLEVTLAPADGSSPTGSAHSSAPSSPLSKGPGGPHVAASPLSRSSGPVAQSAEAADAQGGDGHHAAEGDAASEHHVGFKPAQPLSRNLSSQHKNKVFVKSELSRSAKERQQAMMSLAEGDEEEEEEGEEEAGEEGEEQAEEEGEEQAEEQEEGQVGDQEGEQEEQEEHAHAHFAGGEGREEEQGTGEGPAGHGEQAEGAEAVAETKAEEGQDSKATSTASASAGVGYQGGFRPAQPLARNSSSTHTNKVFMKVELSWSQKRRQQGMTALAEDEEEEEEEEGGEEGEEEEEEGEEGEEEGEEGQDGQEEEEEQEGEVLLTERGGAGEGGGAEVLTLTEEEAMQQTGLTAVEGTTEMDDGTFIDYLVDAMVASLEGHHAHTIEHEAFTLAGWEIDKELEAMVTSMEGHEFDASGHRVSVAGGIPRVSGAGGIPRVSGEGGVPRISGAGGIPRVSGTGETPRTSGLGDGARASSSGEAAAQASS